MAGSAPPGREARRAGKRQGRLGDEVGRVPADLPCVFLPFRRCRVWPDEHPVTAGFANHFHYQPVEVVERVLKALGLRQRWVSTFGSFGSSPR